MVYIGYFGPDNWDLPKETNRSCVNVDERTLLEDARHVEVRSVSRLHLSEHFQGCMLEAYRQGSSRKALRHVFGRSAEYRKLIR